MPLLLGVNIDHVATLRQARYALSPDAPLIEPCVIEAARAAIAGGADSITIHVRSDRRHMLDADAVKLREMLNVPLNLEMAVTDEMAGLALKWKPEFVCLVPENRLEITTEGGLNVLGNFDKTRMTIAKLQDAGIRVSIFIDPDLTQVEAAGEACADMIELHTGSFANAVGDAQEAELSRLIEAAKMAHPSMQVNAGHGIHYQNVASILRIPHLAELNIGHSIISRAVFTGLTPAVKEMKELLAAYSA
ncbi:MAG: pyridoxine 5'-phosphate synthase [Verrucomicrobia bacterium]|nr:MAG: pyridoxine 5'-phosphate synthase [Verrucomicrobiota bacterium]